MVQLYNDGHWRSLFDGNWTKADADVTCKGEGLSGAIEQSDLQGDEKWIKNIISRDYQCNGAERYLTECSYSTYNNSHISHLKAVGVRCKNEGMKS